MAAAGKLVRTLPTITKFANIPLITTTGVTKTTWEDTDILKSSALPLVVLTDDKLGPMVKHMIDGLTGTMTEEGAYNILLLAWNMRSETDPKVRIFPKKTARPSTGKPEELSSSASSHGGGGNNIVIPPTESAELTEFIRQGCFYAASLLKLFAKTADSWIKAQDHIMLNYKKFTDKDFQFGSLTLWTNSVEVVKRLFETKQVYRDTLGQILYSLTQVKEGRGMTIMLFEQHLSYTGLHSVGLFCKSVVGLRTSHEKMLTALRTESTKPALDQLALIISTYMRSETENLNRGTFKYARLYDQNMFSLLQTKNRTDITCILGHLNKMCGIPGTENVMSIAAISAVSDEAQDKYSKIARNIFTHFKVTGGLKG